MWTWWLNPFQQKSSVYRITSLLKHNRAFRPTGVDSASSLNSLLKNYCEQLLFDLPQINSKKYNLVGFNLKPKTRWRTPFTPWIRCLLLCLDEMESGKTGTKKRMERSGSKVVVNKVECSCSKWQKEREKNGERERERERERDLGH